MVGNRKSQSYSAGFTLPRIGDPVEGTEYIHKIRFWHAGKPFLAYTQRTWALDDGRPLHSEAGYVRGLGEGRLFSDADLASGASVVVIGADLVDAMFPSISPIGQDVYLDKSVTVA